MVTSPPGNIRATFLPCPSHTPSTLVHFVIGCIRLPIISPELWSLAICQLSGERNTFHCWWCGATFYTLHPPHPSQNWFHAGGGWTNGYNFIGLWFRCLFLPNGGLLNCATTCGLLIQWSCWLSSIHRCCCCCWYPQFITILWWVYGAMAGWTRIIRLSVAWKEWSKKCRNMKERVKLLREFPEKNSFPKLYSFFLFRASSWKEGN